jgi:hypothetical protein
MSSSILENAFPRISARRGQVVDLNVDFLRNGVLTDPYAIRHVEIYKTSIAPHNLVTTIPIVDVAESNYPSPLYQEESANGTTSIAGSYHLLYSIPDDFVTPDVYFDLWHYFADDPCGQLGTEDPTNCDIDNSTYDNMLLKSCHRFWVYPDEWFTNDSLQTVRFGFEPLDQKFFKPENRPLEIGLMPLPLYDYNFNLVNPIIPFLSPTITIETQHCELLVDNAPARIGIRQGSYRSNPWVIQYDLDTSDFLKGTYRYWLRLALPDGSTRVSRKFIMTIN